MSVPPRDAERRRLALTPKDVDLLEALGEALLNRFATRVLERVADAAEVKADQGGFILGFSYYDFHALL